MVHHTVVSCAIIACNALQLLCNNCRLTNVMESLKLLHNKCSALHAIIAHETMSLYHWVTRADGHEQLSRGVVAYIAAGSQTFETR